MLDCKEFLKHISKTYKINITSFKPLSQKLYRVVVADPVARTILLDMHGLTWKKVFAYFSPWQDLNRRSLERYIIEPLALPSLAPDLLV